MGTNKHKNSQNCFVTFQPYSIFYVLLLKLTALFVRDKSHIEKHIVLVFCPVTIAALYFPALSHLFAFTGFSLSAARDDKAQW